MRHLVWVPIVAVGCALWACGGGAKPPMVPDEQGDPSLVGDGGAGMPAPAK